MDPGDNFLHWTFRGYVLVSIIPLNGLKNFLVGALLTVSICFSERLLTVASERRWSPSWLGCSRPSQALWRASLYGTTSFLRLAYMLIAMSFHFGLILIIIGTLAVTQFFIELHTSHRALPRNESFCEEPLLAGNGVPAGRPHSKSKPDSIFIHPNHSNIARADAVAHELGLSGGANNDQSWPRHTRRDSRQHFQLEDDGSDTD